MLTPKDSMKKELLSEEEELIVIGSDSQDKKINDKINRWFTFVLKLSKANHILTL